MKITVRDHIIEKLKSLNKAKLNYFMTSDLQELSYIGKHTYGKFLGSTETYTREFRRMRQDGVIKVEKVPFKGQQQRWRLLSI